MPQSLYDRMEGSIRTLTAKRDEARAQLAAGPDKVLRCAFCAQPYPDGTPEAKSQILADHIRVCEVHPVGRENRELRERLRQAEACQDAFTKWAEAMISVIPDHPWKQHIGIALDQKDVHELIQLKAASVLQQGMRKP